MMRISVVNRASGDLPRLLCKVDDITAKDHSLKLIYKYFLCEYTRSVLQSCYDIEDLEPLKDTADTSVWPETLISLHAAAKNASLIVTYKQNMHKMLIKRFVHNQDVQMQKS